MDGILWPKNGRVWKSKADFFRPFRTAAADAGENIAPLYDPTLHHAIAVDPDLKDLNVSLASLVEIFPDVEPEIFREMLLSISEESRVQVVMEHLLQRKKNGKWIRGPYKTLRKERVAKVTEANGDKSIPRLDTALPIEMTFRSDEYKKAVKQVFYQEFRALSHSTIKGVMAEQNHSYTTSRPILQHLSTKTLRYNLASLWARRTPSALPADHPSVTWPTGSVDGISAPAVRRTGSAQLDQELYELFVEPIVVKQRHDLLTADHTYASQLNETQAQEADALFDCECCYGSVTFERMSFCDGDAHQLCFECVQRTVDQALYGQGWARTVDLEKSTVRCFAPSAQECHACLPSDTVRCALSGGNETSDAWHEFQSRLASDALTKSRLPLQRCPFCTYAEVDETPALRLRSGKGIWRHVATRSSAATQIIPLFCFAAMPFLTMPLLFMASFLWLIFQIFPSAAHTIEASWARVYTGRRGLKFHCRRPACRRVSCTRCTAQWRDSHTCFESERTSLRTTIESSATAAIKRTCPKCLLSFVKSSGCNKLVCNCGYTMCYVCRQEIGREGYGHFCQHFREAGGRCSGCDRCDLYIVEDEEGTIRRAAIQAEKDWLEREGKSKDTDDKLGAVVNDVLANATGGKRCDYDAWLDFFMGIVLE